MTDKEFDIILKDALTSEEVPSELNRALLKKIQNGKKAKIIAFTKPASVAAAMFICAAAVLGYYNSNMPLRTEVAPPSKETRTVSEKENGISSIDDTTKEVMMDEGKEETAQAPAASPKKIAVGEEKSDAPKVTSDSKKAASEGVKTESAEEKNPDTQSSGAAAASAAETPSADSPEALSENSAAGIENIHSGASANETAAAESISPKEAEASRDKSPAITESAATTAQDETQGFSRSKRKVFAALSELFNDGYDYKGIINERIRAQIAQLPDASEYTFTGISENEAFSLNEENRLTITFPAGEIIPEEHGEQFFTVGIVANGILE